MDDRGRHQLRRIYARDSSHQHRTDLLVRRVTLVVGGLAIVIIVFGIFMLYALDRTPWR